MAIQSGTHLGPYEILSAIGAGGMGEVYRADYNERRGLLRAGRIRTGWHSTRRLASVDCGGNVSNGQRDQ